MSIPTPEPSADQTPKTEARREFRPRYGPPVGYSPAWERELHKLIGREVTVFSCVGISSLGMPVMIEHSGVCLAIQSTHLSVVLMTDTEKIIVKHVSSIRRKRSFNKKPGEKSDGATAE